jgi:hypothetical protein
VRKKQLLLSTNGGAAFLENACCNEDGTHKNPIQYFQKERPELVQVMQKARKMEDVLTRVKNLTKAKTFFDPDSSRIIGASVPDTIISRTIYETFIHYCNFDNDTVIPADLVPLAATKPEYNRFASIEEKVSFMKKHGKNYGLTDFYSIMRTVNSRNLVHLKPDKQINALSGLTDMLTHFDDTNSVLVENKLRELLRDTLANYDPKVAVHEERASNKKLNRYLQRANSGMQNVIVAFLETHTNLTTTNLGKISDFLETVASWNIDDLPSVTKEVQNMIFNISKVYPNKTLANRFQTECNKNWNFSAVHQMYLSSMVTAYYGDIVTYALSGESDTDTVFHQYLTTAVANLTDLVLFMEIIPIFAPLIKNGTKFWTLYSDETIRLLYQYGFLSAIHEYVILANDPAFVQLQAEEVKPLQIESEEDYGATASQIRQVHIVESDTAELKKTAAKWLSAVLKREMDTKTTFNHNYTEIMDNTMSLKYKDKKNITDYLANLSRDERRVEQMLRSHKIGRWNVGMQKGLYQYDKATYDSEVIQWQMDTTMPNQNITGEDAEGENVGNGEDIEDLERMDRIRHSEEYDGGDGIEDMTEEYMDGIYYEEDAEREDGF